MDELLSNAREMLRQSADSSRIVEQLEGIPFEHYIGWIDKEVKALHLSCSVMYDYHVLSYIHRRQRIQRFFFQCTIVW